MSGAVFTILSAVIWMIIVISFVKTFTKAVKKRGPVSSDGHVVPPEQDITCEGRDKHKHPQMSAAEKKDYGPRYIVHNDPETGYVILNGVKRRISDCKDL